MRRRRNIIVFAALLTFAIACYWMLQREDIHWKRKFAVVKEGVLLRSRVPTIPGLQEMERRYGIKTIVSLLDYAEIKHPEYGAEQNFANQHGITFVHLPISGVPSPEVVKKFLEIVDSPANQPVLVHCWHGTVRTGVLVAIYRIKEEGWPFQKALDEMISYGFKPKSPQYKSMVDLILRYTSKTESKVAPATN